MIRESRVPGAGQTVEKLVRQIDSSVVGYIVLTKQPDGSWRDDWDGQVHSTYELAYSSVSDTPIMGERDVCRIVECRWAEEPS